MCLNNLDNITITNSLVNQCSIFILQNILEFHSCTKNCFARHDFDLLFLHGVFLQLLEEYKRRLKYYCIVLHYTILLPSKVNWWILINQLIWSCSSNINKFMELNLNIFFVPFQYILLFLFHCLIFSVTVFTFNYFRSLVTCQ